ncbi:hypothetical protein N3K63_07110 [Microbacterium sp. W1N]|uniref:hypothetical protein n=1 Tax=Microbacterium festucae TaxID=2977531 RepID=UPI0021C1C425|nr:hypothetical protein [Microbacterium festucae]MCT9820055.1 hypothetical protein [Microbacterium festucae]
MSDRILVSKIANALVEDAEARVSGVGLALSGFRALWGGLWVGGRVTLTEETVEFSPNVVNRAAQSGTLDVSISLKDVTGVEVLPGILTRIVAIATPARVLKVRCWGAHRFAARVIAACAGASGQA